MDGLTNPLEAVRKPAAGRERIFYNDDDEARLLAACSAQKRVAGCFSSGAQSFNLRPTVEFALATLILQKGLHTYR